MLPTGAVTSYIDWSAIWFTVFWLFFFYLLFYLRREDRREGYPLETDIPEKNVINPDGGLFEWIPKPKVFLLRDGTTAMAPNPARDVLEKKMTVRAEPVSRGPGMPLQPVGNPLTSGAGPAAYSLRADTPDKTVDGANKIVPMRLAKAFFVEPRDVDPRGLNVVATDGVVAGQVSDLWIDLSEDMIRYLEVKTKGGRSVLLPITMAQFRKARRVNPKASIAERVGGHEVFVDSITAAQFEGVPGTKGGGSVTLREEDQITAYFGAGHLYAKPDRLYWL